MAEAILFGVAQKMIANLGSQIFQEIGSLWGVKDELEKNKKHCFHNSSLLLDAAEQQNHNHQVRDWLEKLKDTVYEADDLLGEFSIEALRRRAVSGNKFKKEIIASATGNALGNLEIDQLQSQLREKIDQKKYLLVLDDVWNEDHERWLNLKNLLMGGSKGSKIIITITHTISPYFLKGLSKNQSWLLFEQVAFRKEQETNNPKLVTIGREIIERCQCVPLAIKSIGSVLYFKETEYEWSCVKKTLHANATQPENSTLSILKLSYDHLSSQLKSCLAYCSLFLKDYEMDKETLIQLWIAQGFIQLSNENQQSEDVGDEYFKHLLWRSFFEEVTNSRKGLKYKMHDLIHDLAQSVVGIECKLIDFDDKNINAKTLHVSCPFLIGLSFTETLSLLVKVEKIRTFLLTYDMRGSGVLEESMLNTLVLSFKSLYALDLHELKITRIPDSVEKLIHLRCLNLSFN